MALLEKERVCCEQCGALLEEDATILGCLNCLLGGGLNELEPENRRFQHYELCLRADGMTLDELGRGAMGITYRARDLNLDSLVALKVISAAYSNKPEARERFRREARAAAQLRHPNVASVFHFGETEDGQFFYVMELVEGETLEARVRRDGPLTPGSALEIAEQVCRALIAAETHGLVHRDLKPSNLMVTEFSTTDTLLVKVIDFGLAQAVVALQKDATIIHPKFSGTPEFASPEQFDSAASVDARSDIYSLGATLWYLLCGRAPFAGNGLAEIRGQQRQLPLDQLAKLPTEIAALLRSMLATKPEARPQSPRELLTAIRACREGVSRRNRRKLITIGFTLVALCAFGLASYLFRRQTESSAPPEKSIAVLPFENLSANKEDAFFATGVQDEILSDLAKIADLKVISRTSVSQYQGGTPRNIREIGRALGVAHVLEGSVQRVANRARVNAQLIDTRTDAHLWAETYDRDVADVFAIQDEIAQKIADQLQAKISPPEKAAIEKPPTKDLLAYDLYVRAVALIDPAFDDPDLREDVLNGIKFLDAAIAHDPSFLLAYCKLAEAHDYLYFQDGRSRGQLAQAGSAVNSALQLGPDSGEAHLSLALHLYWGYSDYDRARAELAIASHTLPNNPRIARLAGLIDRRQGRWSDAARELERSAELDPRNLTPLDELITTYSLMRSYGHAAQVIDRRAALKPNGIGTRLPRANIDVAARADTRPLHALLQELITGDPPTAEYLAEESFWLGVLERDPDAADRALTLARRAKKAISAEPTVVQLSYPFWEGFVARMKGDNVAARAAFLAARSEQEEIVRSQSGYGPALSALGLIDAYLGRKEDALSEARRGVELLPVAKNALEGADALYCFAVICALIGERDLALQQLDVLAKIPSGTTYGDLRLNPYWDSLRGDPRFEKIVASLAPKNGR